jgi:large subunit ribosomal protein L15
MKLSELAPARGARKSRKRIGRGNASGAGRTSGRGEKGQKARSGASIRAGFEGGQMPLYRRLPKFGFSSRKQVLGLNNFALVNLAFLERFENDTVVDETALKKVGVKISKKQRAGIKVLGNGNLSKKLHLKVQAFSATAKEKIESLGGSIEIVKRKYAECSDE